jgi:hypothetical protein
MNADKRIKKKKTNKQTSDEMESWKMRMMSHSFDDDDDDDDTCSI